MTRPSVSGLIGLAVLLAGAAFGGLWYARHRAAGDLSAHADSLKVVLSARDTVAARVAQLEQYAAAQQAIAATATQKADSLTRLADRHRTYRLRVIDSAHVAVTASDTDRKETISEVPVQITEQLALDSAALAAQDARGESDGTLLAVQGMEIRTLTTQVRLDSLAMHQLEGEVADLTALKAPRFTFTEGVVATVSVIAIIKLVALLVVH